MKQKSILVLLAAASLMAACNKTPDPVGTVSLSNTEATLPFYGGTIEYTVDANCAWEVFLTDSSSPLTITPTSGVSGQTPISITVPGNETQEDISYEFSVVLTNSEGVTQTLSCTLTLPKPEVTYGDVTYKVVYLQDGNYWMAENLRYVPEGKTVSDDLTALDNGVWYPLTLNSDASGVEFGTSDSYVAEAGLLYSTDVAFGTKVTIDNYKSFEGTQGICPDGWHIPTVDEILALVGKANGKDTNTEAPYYDVTLSNGNGSGSMEKLAADGFTLEPLAGLVNVTNSTTKTGTLSGYHKTSKQVNTNYFLGSSVVKDDTKNDDGSLSVQYYSLMTAKKNGTIAGAYQNYRSGVNVRCVLDK